MKKVDKQNKNKTNNSKKVDKTRQNSSHEEHEYNFIPNLNEWLNIDKQRERTKELEDI